MPTMTVYVSDEMKKRMDKLRDAPSWSSVFQDAVQRVLSERAAQKKDKKMDDVVERLRASAREAANDQESTGREHGESWARNTADAGELRRIERLWNGMSPGDCARWFLDVTDSDTAAHRFAVAVLGEEAEHADVAEFWERLGFEREWPDGNYVYGFASGAVEVWESVKGKL